MSANGPQCASFLCLMFFIFLGYVPLLMISPLYVCCFGLLSEYITKSLAPPHVADCFEHYRPKKKNLSNMIKCIACSLWLSSKFSHLPTLYSISSLICKRNTYYTWDLFRCHCAANMWEKWHFIRLRHAIVDGMSVKCVNNPMEYSLDYHQCLIGYVACMVDLFG